MANYYFLEKVADNKGYIYDDIHHIKKVARHKKGEIIGILKENEGRGKARIISITNSEVVV